MQAFKTLMTRDLGPKGQGLVLLAAGTCATVGLVGIALTPSLANGPSLLTLMVLAGIAGAVFYKSYLLLSCK